MIGCLLSAVSPKDLFGSQNHQRTIEGRRCTLICTVKVVLIEAREGHMVAIATRTFWNDGSYLGIFLARIQNLAADLPSPAGPSFTIRISTGLNKRSFPRQIRITRQSTPSTARFLLGERERRTCRSCIKNVFRSSFCSAFAHSNILSAWSLHCSAGFTCGKSGHCETGWPISTLENDASRMKTGLPRCRALIPRVVKLFPGCL